MTGKVGKLLCAVVSTSGHARQVFALRRNDVDVLLDSYGNFF